MLTFDPFYGFYDAASGAGAFEPVKEIVGPRSAYHHFERGFRGGRD